MSKETYYLIMTTHTPQTVGALERGCVRGPLSKSTRLPASPPRRFSSSSPASLEKKEAEILWVSFEIKRYPSLSSPYLLLNQ